MKHAFMKRPWTFNACVNFFPPANGFSWWQATFECGGDTSSCQGPYPTTAVAENFSPCPRIYTAKSRLSIPKRQTCLSSAISSSMFRLLMKSVTWFFHDYCGLPLLLPCGKSGKLVNLLWPTTISKEVYLIYLTPWLMEPLGSMLHSQGFSNNSYPEPNQPNSPHWYLSLQGSF